MSPPWVQQEPQQSWHKQGAVSALRPCLLQSPWNGKALPCLQPARPCEPSTTSTEPIPFRTGQTLAPPRAQAHAQPWQVSAVPSADSSSGTKPGRSDAKPAASGIRSAWAAGGPYKQSLPCLRADWQPQSTGALPGARDVPLSPWACVRSGTEGRGTGTAFIGGMSPTCTPGRKKGRSLEDFSLPAGLEAAVAAG